jgi:hypothetical protein
MPIPNLYKPFLEKLLDRSRRGEGRWKESARLEEFIRAADGYALLTYRTDPVEGPVQISVRILNRSGDLIFREMIQPGDPDYTILDELNTLARRSLEGTASVPS